LFALHSAKVAYRRGSAIGSTADLPRLSVETLKRPQKTWRLVLDLSAPLILPAAHDALTAQVIEQAD
jgi:hypothetical protein